jgi:hypothetical protein
MNTGTMAGTKRFFNILQTICPPISLRRNHRYLMTRLIELTSRLPVTSCIVDSTAIYIMVVKFRNTIWPPPPQLSLHRRAALSRNSNGTRSYIAERTQNAVYIVRCRLGMLNPSQPEFKIARPHADCYVHSFNTGTVILKWMQILFHTMPVILQCFSLSLS